MSDGCGSFSIATCAITAIFEFEVAGYRNQEKHSSERCANTQDASFSYVPSIFGGKSRGPLLSGSAGFLFM